jgi:predicted phosphodiesterase
MAPRNPAPTPSLEAFGEEREKLRLEESSTTGRKLRAAQSIAVDLEKEVEKLRKQLGLYEGLYDANEKRKTPEWLVPPRVSTHRAIPSLMLTDIHWDEVIQPDEVEGFNCYTSPIQNMRVKRAFTKSVELTRDYFKGVAYDGFQLFLGGDMISGIIHEELTETNGAQLAESILGILDPLEAGIKLLAQEFKKVHITCVVGNHGRRTRKPRAKYRAKDNFDWLIYKLLERNLTGVKDVTIDVSPSADATTTLYSTRYRLTHGDQFRGGSGIAAELSPLLLGNARKSKRQSSVGKPYDVLVMGHWHQTLWLPSKGVIMGGSVCGYNEYGYISNFAPEAPQCSLWLTTPEHGITLCAPVFVQNRKEEGW